MRARSIVVGIALSPFAVAFGCGARTGWVELDERSTADAAPADARATGAPTDTSAPTATPTSTPTSPTSTTTPSTVPTGNVFCVPTSPVPTVTC